MINISCNKSCDSLTYSSIVNKLFYYFCYSQEVISNKGKEVTDGNKKDDDSEDKKSS